MLYGMAAAMEMPHLLTDRLVLRPFVPDDLAEYAAICADPEVMRYIGNGQPRTIDVVQEWLTATIYRWDQKRVPMWAVRRRGEMALLGRCGFQPLRGTEEIELAYTLAQSAWGQGIATEAGRACLTWAMAHRSWPKVVALARPANAASLRVM